MKVPAVQVLRMHVETKRTAIELRDAKIDRVAQLRSETGPLHCLGQSQHHLVSVGIGFAVSQAVLRRNLLLFAALGCLPLNGRYSSTEL